MATSTGNVGAVCEGGSAMAVLPPWLDSESSPVTGTNRIYEPARPINGGVVRHVDHDSPPVDSSFEALKGLQAGSPAAGKGSHRLLVE